MFDRVLNTPLENTRKQLGIQQKKNPEKLFAVTGQWWSEKWISWSFQKIDWRIVLVEPISKSLRAIDLCIMMNGLFCYSFFNLNFLQYLITFHFIFHVTLQSNFKKYLNLSFYLWNLCKSIGKTQMKSR